MIPVLRGERVVLRGFTWADFAPFAAMWQEPKVAQFIPFAPVGPRQSWARFNMNISRWISGGFGNWAVVSHAGEFLGTTGFFRGMGGYGAGYDDAIQSGWVFASHSHGNGYASEATGLAHDWLDQQGFGGRSVRGMGSDHAASIRIAEKAGYTFLRLSNDEWGQARLMERVRTR